MNTHHDSSASEDQRTLQAIAIDGWTPWILQSDMSRDEYSYTPGYVFDEAEWVL